MMYNSEMTDAEVVFEVEKYISENDYCPVETACAALGILPERYWKARWRRREEMKKKMEEAEKLLKERKDEEYYKALMMLESLRCFLDEECEKREYEEQEQEQDDYERF